MDIMNNTQMSPAFMAGNIKDFLIAPTGATPLKMLSPWYYFDKAWTLLMGYPAEEFRFVPGQTPMSTLRETAIFITLYYIVVLGGREVMRNRQPFKLSLPFKIHNFYLTAISGGLLVLFLEQLAPALWNNGLYDGICGGSGWTDKLVVLYYLNYLTKYLELIDTCFLFLRKKPLTFLHTYHHGATALLCFTQLLGHTSVSWVPITLNLTVHVVMYWYYFQAARGIKIWWKKYITIMQIVQFVIDLGFVYFASWDYFTSTYAPSLPHVGTCAGEEFAAFSGCAILSSYLLLFISFYFATYKKSGKSDMTAAKKSAVDMKNLQVPTAPQTRDAVGRRLSAAATEIKAVADKMPN